MRKFLLIFLIAILPTSVFAEFQIEDVSYTQKDVTLQGRAVYKKGSSEKLPVVVVFHDWMGPTDVTLDAAQKIAGMGYLAFIADIYGKDVRPASVKEASDTSSFYKTDRKLMRERANAALGALKKVRNADASKVATIGFCFGGTVSLELARSGAPVLASVSFHGGLETPDVTLAKNIKGKVLALHGADDPFVPDSEVAGFEKEMREAKVDWQLVKYGNAVHAFTNKKADSLNIPGAAYQAEADRRSFEVTRQLLDEIF